MPDAPAPFSAMLLLAALGAGVVVLMLLALFLPTASPDEGTNWTVALVGGLVAAVVVFGVGALRRSRRTNAEPPR